MVYLIDTNIFLEILLDQPRAADCTRLLNHLYEEGIPIVASIFSIHSVLIHLVNRKKFEKIEDFVSKIKKSEHILLYHDEIEEHVDIATVCSKTGLDFDDGMQYYIAQRLNCEAIISYDPDFDRMDIPRKTPKDFRF